MKNLTKVTLSGLSVLVLSVLLVGCSSPKAKPTEEPDTAPVAPEKVFEAVGSIPEHFVLLAGAKDKVTPDLEFAATIAEAGNCLGLITNDRGLFTAVWPSDSLVLKTKFAVEFDSLDWEGDTTRVRLNILTSPIVTGKFVTAEDVSWWDQIPPVCTLSEQGIFIVDNAYFPAPEEAEEAG